MDIAKILSILTVYGTMLFLHFDAPQLHDIKLRIYSLEQKVKRISLSPCKACYISLCEDDQTLLQAHY